MMKTTNRPTCTTRPTVLASLEMDLEATVRSLWTNEPQVHHEERRTAIFELLEVETDIQRLLLRQAANPHREDDSAEVEEYARRLLDLKQRWSGESTQPDVLLEAFP